jgi:hypothetical protein
MTAGFSLSARARIAPPQMRSTHEVGMVRDEAPGLVSSFTLSLTEPNQRLLGRFFTTAGQGAQLPNDA